MNSQLIAYTPLIACHAPSFTTTGLTFTPWRHARGSPFQSLNLSNLRPKKGENRCVETSAQAKSSFSPSSAPTGIFLRDSAMSDIPSYERALALLELGKLQRLTAVQLIEGVELEQRGNLVTLRFLTVVPFFKVSEKYRLGGTLLLPRRDLRSGDQTATASIEDDGTLHLQSRWGEPNAGSVDERLKLLDGGDVLEYVSTLKVAKGTETTKQVYRRVDSWKPKYSWNPLKALQFMSKEEM